ncbi:hypothetical protein GCM10008995_26240 [Halobellus salinus]|uniref:DUF7319 domain-containing protein n=1 Tax=Halobellus salinus TaxID=931585 RepID=A0A830ERQ1_9EURY|nr:hypothetical protein [Halobellus salinus]GGJ15179.1 hypothetical protein GCM10008995_26240 [Halobellus salinus]SMP32778.1 hypothetical protein SAMN06265347_12130 [Halobellus salinus]
MTESPERPSAADRRSNPPGANEVGDAEASASTGGTTAAEGGAGERDVAPTDADGSTEVASVAADEGGGGEDDLEALREQVEETYDFESFGPADMADMSLEEWEAAFDPETWIVGEELLDRVEQELEARVAIREIFAIVERVSDGEDRVIAYSDEGYAVIYADGSIEGEGTVLRDVKPTVALCSMDSYELMDQPAERSLPEPREVVEGSGEFGNLMLQIVAGAQVVVGIGLAVAWLALPSLSTVVAPIASIGFLAIGFFLFLVVANARLSDRFRVEEFRNRLRALENAGEEWGDVLPEEARGAIDAGSGSDDSDGEFARDDGTDATTAETGSIADGPDSDNANHGGDPERRSDTD